MKNKEDDRLVQFLSTADPHLSLTLVKMMDSILSIDVEKLKSYKTEEDIPKSMSPERTEYSEGVVNQLRYFGSHNIAYILRNISSEEPGVHYPEILRDVLKILNKELKEKVEIPRVDTVDEYEMILCELLLKITFQDKPLEKIIQMLENSGLDKDSSILAAKQLAKKGAAGAGLVGLVKILGQRTVTVLIEKIIMAILTKWLGEEAAKKMAEKILGKLAQKTFAKVVTGIGVFLIVWDVIDLGKSATRITVPCVSLIAATRVSEKLNRF